MLRLPFEHSLKRNGLLFLAGLPLAYYSSFPLFALTHLIVIWCAVLGDDVVIADELLAKLEIGKRKSFISKPKSLISHTASDE